MRYKKGVSTHPMQPTMELAKNLLSNIIEELFEDKELVITSTYDGLHKKGSLHYIGLAFDWRSRIFTEHQIKEIIDEFKKRTLDIRYQFVIEQTHVHLEYDRRINNEKNKVNKKR